MDIKCTLPNELMGDYYEQRASGGLLISEATAISEAASGWRNAPHIRGPEHAEAWKNITDRVHAKGGLIFCQLWHMGRQAHSSFHPSTGQTFAPSAIKFDGDVKTTDMENVPGEIPHAMTIEEIQTTIQDYVNAAKLSKEAGFDGVEVHAANGYLLDEFLQSSSNKRTDQYGGSPDNRVRLLEEVVQAIIDSGAFPANRIGFRVSPNGAFGGMGSEDNNTFFPFVSERMSKYGLAYLHMMDGLGFGYHELCAPVTAFDMKKNFGGPLICNVGLTKEVAEGMIRSGAADLACFGRLYMSNPDLPERFENNWPLNADPAYETWWSGGTTGYADYPTYKEDEKKE